ncbi:hypothetical protein [Maribacter sp. 2210JD10-5]|uniref:hypothetical protein n=1 Tax=Maribacter sp. 2210JD10-5 TaxID=3386272 RepID=UPI0039BCD842
MKAILPFIFMLLIPFIGLCQSDIPTQKPLKIEAVKKADPTGNTKSGPVLNIPSVIQPQPKFDLDKKNPIKMLPDEELVQAGTGLKIDPRIGPREKEGSSQYFPDQYLGDVKSNGKFVGIVCRDHEYVDGDRVKIYVNDVVVDPNMLLTGAFKGVNVDLQSGFNKLEFEALNHGSSAPNTAQVDVYNDEGQLIYSNKWLLSSGSKATLIVTKE